VEQIADEPVDLDGMGNSTKGGSLIELMQGHITESGGSAIATRTQSDSNVLQFTQCDGILQSMDGVHTRYQTGLDLTQLYSITAKWEEQ
jgi:hypothetical protein